jgi:hypothetical protein
MASPSRGDSELLVKDEVHEEERKDHKDGGARDSTRAPQGNRRCEQPEEHTYYQKEEHHDCRHRRLGIDHVGKRGQLETAVLGKRVSKRLIALHRRQANEAAPEENPTSVCEAGGALPREQDIDENGTEEERQRE